MDTNRDDAFDMQPCGLRGVLRTRLEENLRAGADGNCRCSCRLRHCWGQILAEIDWAGDGASGVDRGPVPPVTPSFTPRMPFAGPLSWPDPCSDCSAEPEPRLTAVGSRTCAGVGGVHVGEAFIPEIDRAGSGPCWERGRWDSFVLIRGRRSVALAVLLTTEAGIDVGQIHNLREPGAGCISLGGAGKTTGTGCSHFDLGRPWVRSGSLSSGSLILGGIDLGDRRVGGGTLGRIFGLIRFRLDLF